MTTILRCIALAAGIAILTAVAAEAGELMPYQLPSQSATYESSPPPATKNVTPTVTSKTMEKIHDLSETKKKELRKKLKEKLDQCIKDNDLDRADRYMALIKIIDKAGYK